MGKNNSTAIHIEDEQKDRALLISVWFQTDDDEFFHESLAELYELAETAGAIVVDSMVQKRSAPDTKFFIGKGKLEEIDLIYGEDELDVLIFNHELSASQIRNLEKESGLKVITRTELILDIFAIHARTKTARLQVELAQLQYQLPRIMGKGLVLSRTGGGIGTRGPGETQLETDRRFIRGRIHDLREKLKEVEKQRSTQRKQRGKEFKAAIVGYTNSGKSTLLNHLTKADVLEKDRLFATLDTTTRKLWLGEGRQVLLTDTVGFIRDLPHTLIESFHSTLEETIEANVLLHVADISSSSYREKIRVVRETLKEISAGEIPVVFIFNKIDLVSPEELLSVRKDFPDALYLSAAEGTNVESLKERLFSLAPVPHYMKDWENGNE